MELKALNLGALFLAKSENSRKFTVGSVGFFSRDGKVQHGQKNDHLLGESQLFIYL